MPKLKKALSKGTAPAIVGIVLLTVLFVFVGLSRDLPTVWLYIGIAVGVVLIFVLWMVQYAKKKKGATKIKSGLRDEADKQVSRTRPDRRDDVRAHLNKRNEALEYIGQKLYEVPFYLVIGPTGQGKTTIIKESGLNFPRGDEHTAEPKGEGTRDSTWFVADNVILIDTAGRYVTDEEGDEGWSAFLDILKEARPRKPINGVLVGISLEELSGDRVNIQKHADALRRRINKLVEKLGVLFPIYLVFTKCDRIPGFVDFFRGSSYEQQKQVWGCTLDKRQMETAAASRIQTPAPRDLFVKEFQRLYDSLVTLRAERLSRREGHSKERLHVYGFPLEFAALKDNLAFFVERLFPLNPYKENPDFRGFYFTSGTQEGAPIDGVIESMARKLDLSPEVTEEAETTLTAKSYFIEDLFSDVIIKDQHMVLRRREGSRLGTGMIVALVALLALTALGVVPAFLRSKKELHQVREVSNETAGIRWRNPAMADDNLRRMVPLRTVLEDLKAPLPLWKNWGMTRRAEVLGPAQELYSCQARIFVETYALPALEARLRRGSREVRAAALPALEPRRRGTRDVRESTFEGTTTKEDLFQDLRAYLLLTSESRRLEDEQERGFLGGWLTKLAQDSLDYRLSIDARRSLQQQIKHQDSTFVSDLGSGTACDQAFISNPNLIRAARDAISIKPELYSLLKQRGRDELGMLTLVDVLERDVDDILIPENSGFARGFATRPEVSRFFTKAGYDFLKQEIQKEKEQPGLAWVLAANGRPSNTTQDAVDMPRLERRYFKEYAEAWEGFLGGVRHQSFRSIDHAAERLSEISDAGNSPLLYLLARVAHETQFDSVGATPHVVSRQFRSLHRLNPTSAVTGQAPILSRVLERMGQVGSKLNELTGDDGSAAGAYTAQVVQGNGDLLGRTLIAIEYDLARFDRNTRENLFERPIIMSWEVVRGAAQAHLNDRWKQEVCEPFQENLARQYPFVRDGRGARLGDFREYFHQDTGPIFDFFENLEDEGFVDGSMNPREWSGRGIGIDDEARGAYQKATTISNALFTDVLTFELIAQQPLWQSVDVVPIGHIKLDIHGESYDWYMGGTEWKSFEWEPRNPRAELIVRLEEGLLQPLSSGARYQHDDEWALFRLLEEGTVTSNPVSRQARNLDNVDYELRWFFERGVTIRYHLRTGIRSSSSDLFRNVRRFFDFRCPDTLD